MQERKIIDTGDGSHTVQVPQLNVTYHSIHGAVQESKHVFIEAGLNFVKQQAAEALLSVFEMGFGTGLNAYLTALEAEKNKISIHYTTVELHPLSRPETELLNYSQILQDGTALFPQLHQCPWNKEVKLASFFTICKEQEDLLHYSTARYFHLVYYDAFAPGAQPELWTPALFLKLFHLLHDGGVLVTYCSKGDVRRALIAAGFTVTKIPGPPGKREMLRAVKSPSLTLPEREGTATAQRPAHLKMTT